MSSEFNDLPDDSLVAVDHALQQANDDIPTMLEQATASSGKSMGRIRFELVQGFAWPGRITPVDYLAYRLFEKTKTERREFISDWVHWPIESTCGDADLSPVTVDKWLCTQRLREAGIPTAPIVAVIDPEQGVYGDIPTISTTAELLKTFDYLGQPLFAKPKKLLGSLGAFRIDHVNDDYLVYNRDKRVNIDGVINGLMGGIPYVVQPVVENHEKIAAIASSLATVRVVNMVASDGVRIAAAAFKIPTGDNVADNFWRAGNLIADVDPETGVLRRIVRGSGPNQTECPIHPESGVELLGMELPFWRELIRVNSQTAELFSPIRYQSLDIAFTEEGPVVIEVNSGGSFFIPQVASGRGFLTAENREFFEDCGVNFRRLVGPLDELSFF